MALKTDFEDADFIATPFVDEVANPGQTQLRAARNTALQGRVREHLQRGGTSERQARIQQERFRTKLSKKQKETIAATNRQVAAEEKRTGVKHIERIRPGGAPRKKALE